MTASPTTVSTVADLLSAIADAGNDQIVVSGRTNDVTALRLAPGQVLQGEDDDAALVFVAGCDGVQLTRDNQIHSLRISCAPDRRVGEEGWRIVVLQTEMSSAIP